MLTAVQVAGEGGMGEEEVVDVGVLLEWRNISSSMVPWPDGDVATRAGEDQDADNNPVTTDTYHHTVARPMKLIIQL